MPPLMLWVGFPNWTLNTLTGFRRTGSFRVDAQEATSNTRHELFSPRLKTVVAFVPLNDLVQLPSPNVNRKLTAVRASPMSISMSSSMALVMSKAKAKWGLQTLSPKVVFAPSELIRI